jgi:hypothetical protein
MSVTAKQGKTVQTNINYFSFGDPGCASTSATRSNAASFFAERK